MMFLIFAGYKGDFMKFRRSLSLFLCVLFLINLLVASDLYTVAATEENVTIEDVPATESNDCDAFYDVTYKFQKTRKPIDLVIVQDNSGSFTSNVDKVKEGLYQLVDSLDTTIDRVQFTYYSGAGSSTTILANQLDNDVPNPYLPPGYTRYTTMPRGFYYDFNNDGEEDLGIMNIYPQEYIPIGTPFESLQPSRGAAVKNPVTLVTEPLTSDKTAIKNAIGAMTPGGATPTASGIQEALKEYEDSKGSGGEERQTIFLVITDGIANVDIEGVIYSRVAASADVNLSGFVRIQGEDHFFEHALDDAEEEINKIGQKGYIVNVGFFENFDADAQSLYNWNCYDIYDLYNEILENPGVTRATLKADMLYERSCYFDYMLPTAVRKMNGWPQNGGFSLAMYDNSGSIDQFVEQLIRQTEEQIFSSDELDIKVSDGLTIDKDSIQIVSAPAGDDTAPEWKDENNILWELDQALNGEYEFTFRVKATRKGNYTVAVTRRQGETTTTETKELLVETLSGCSPQIPKKEVSDTDGGRATDNRLQILDRNDYFTWLVTYEFGDDTSDWLSVELTDALDSRLDYSDITIQLKDTTNVAAPEDYASAPNAENWLKSVSGSNITITLNPVNSGYKYLEGKKYTLIIKTKISEDVTDEQLEALIEDDQGIPNKGKIIVSNAQGEIFEKESNEPNVFPPAGPTINKTVSDADGGKETDSILALEEKEQLFRWNVFYEFGNTQDNWTKVVLSDEVDEDLKIQEVRLVDASEVSDASALWELDPIQVINDPGDNHIAFELASEGGFSYLENKKYAIVIMAKIKDDISEDRLKTRIEEGGIPNTGNLAVTKGETSFNLPSNEVKVLPPQKPEIHKDIEDKQHLDLENRGDTFSWHIKVNFGNTTKDWSQVVITDPIKQVFSVSPDDITIKDENDNDVISNGVLELNEDNVLTFTLKKGEDNTYGYLSGHTYTITIKARISEETDDLELAPYIIQGGIPNQAELAFIEEGTSIYSEEPTIMPPSNEPEIHKDIINEEDQEDPLVWRLVDRYDEFDWHIKVDFGTDAYKWSSVVIRDDIYPSFDILKITVKDEKGADVSEKGTFSNYTADNKVVFTLKGDASDQPFAYLVGHTYTITITTKVRDGENPALLSYQGIPNTAYLEYDNAVLESEEPRVLCEKGSFAFIKTDESDKELAGAEFKLFVCQYKDEEGHEHSELVDNTEDNCWILYKTVTSEEATGAVIFSDMPKQDYMLVETKAPNGYILPVGQWLLQPAVDDGKLVFMPTAKKGEEEKLPPAFKVMTDDDNAAYYTLPNYRNFTLPLTGGKGARTIAVCGAVLVCMAGIWFVLSARKNINKLQ